MCVCIFLICLMNLLKATIILLIYWHAYMQTHIFVKTLIFKNTKNLLLSLKLVKTSSVKRKLHFQVQKELKFFWINFVLYDLWFVALLHKKIKFLPSFFSNLILFFFQNIFRFNLPLVCHFPIIPNLLNSFKCSKSYKGCLISSRVIK